ncbi:MAG: hypothetical protein OHK0031_13390 [Anaerolineales bacterium]
MKAFFARLALALRNVLLFPFRLLGAILGWIFRPVWQRIQRGKIYRFFASIKHFMTAIPEDKPLLDAFGHAVKHPDEVVNELEAVRWHILRSLIALSLTILVSFAFTQNMVEFLAGPIGGLEKLQAIEITESLSVFMRVALLTGIALATPYIAFEIWLFAAPGIYPTARWIGLFSIPFALIFFLGGAWFAYQIMLPAALPFLLDFLGIAARPRPESYFTFVTGLMFWLGVSFEFPLVIFALSGMGLVKPGMLLKHWRIAVILIAIAAAIITPTIDPVNMALVMGPMIALYFLSIIFSAIAARFTRAKSKIPVP